MEIPSLARSTPHKSNRNGSSTASYSSSGGNYGVLSWKSPHFINYRALWLIDHTNFVIFPPFSLLLLLFKIIFHSWVWLLVSAVVCPEPLEFNQATLDYLRGRRETVWSWCRWRSVQRKPKHEADGDDRKDAAALGVCAGVCVCVCVLVFVT